MRLAKLSVKGGSNMPQPNLSSSPSRYGAPMGRPSQHHNGDGSSLGKIGVRRIRLNSGGYDIGGAYWGIGKPLYWAASDCGRVDMFFRATDRSTAIAYLRRDYPEARFHRGA